VIEALFVVLVLVGAFSLILAAGAAIADRLPRRWL